MAKDAERAGRAPIIEQPRSDQLSRLIDGLVTVTDTEIARIQRDRGAVDADQLLKLANTVKTLEPLLSSKPSRQPSTSEADTPKTTLGKLRDSATTEAQPISSTPVAERPLDAQPSAFPTDKVDNGLAA